MSSAGVEVDKAKIAAIERFRPHPTRRLREVSRDMQGSIRDHLNRSSVKKVMTVLPKSRKAVKCRVSDGNLKKKRRHYLVKPNLFLLLWGMKIPSLLLLGGNFLPNLNPFQAYIYPIT